MDIFQKQIIKHVGDHLVGCGILDRTDNIIMSIRLPLAPSTNKLNTQAGNHKRRPKLASVVRWDGEAVARVRLWLGADYQPDPDQLYRVTLIHTFSKRNVHSSDADNRLKQALDSLARGMQVNDRQFIDVRPIKAGLAEWGQPSTLIVVQQVTAADYRSLVAAVEYER